MTDSMFFSRVLWGRAKRGGRKMRMEGSWKGMGLKISSSRVEGRPEPERPPRSSFLGPSIIGPVNAFWAESF